MLPTLSVPLSVLLVEDSDDDVFFFRHALQKACVDSTLIHISNGRQAIEYLQLALDSEDFLHPWPAAIFLDLKLPEFSGFEILRWIGDHQRKALSSVFVLSGSEQQSDRARAAALGAAEYIVKAISSLQLRERLLRLCPAADTLAARVPQTPRVG